MPRQKIDTTPATIRAWAKLNGWQVGDRGRIAGQLRDEYLAAMKAQK